MGQSQSIVNLAVEVHGGGMLSGERRRSITADWRAYVISHDERISEVSGQPFGEKYRDILLNDTSIVLDSTPPTIAVLVAQDLFAAGVNMLNSIQRAYFLDGKKIFSFDVLSHLASEIGMNSSYFRNSYDSLIHRVEDHIHQSKCLLQKIGGQGFPSAALEVDGEYLKLDIDRFYGKPNQWITYLHKHLNH